MGAVSGRSWRKARWRESLMIYGANHGFYQIAPRECPLGSENQAGTGAGNRASKAYRISKDDVGYCPAGQGRSIPARRCQTARRLERPARRQLADPALRHASAPNFAPVGPRREACNRAEAYRSAALQEALRFVRTVGIETRRGP